MVIIIQIHHNIVFRDVNSIKTLLIYQKIKLLIINKNVVNNILMY